MRQQQCRCFCKKTKSSGVLNRKDLDCSSTGKYLILHYINIFSVIIFTKTYKTYFQNVEVVLNRWLSKASIPIPSTIAEWFLSPWQQESALQREVLSLLEEACTSIIAWLSWLSYSVSRDSCTMLSCGSLEAASPHWNAHLLGNGQALGSSVSLGAIWTWLCLDMGAAPDLFSQKPPLQPFPLLPKPGYLNLTWSLTHSS